MRCISKSLLILFALIYWGQISFPAWAMFEDKDDRKPKIAQNLMILPHPFLLKVTTFLDPGSLCYLRAVNHSFKQMIPHPSVIIEKGQKVSNNAKTSDSDSPDSSPYSRKESTVPYSYNAKNLGTYLQHSTNLQALDLVGYYQIKSGRIFPYLTNLTNLCSLSLPSLEWSHEESFPLWLGKNTCLQNLILERSLNPRWDAKISVFNSLGLLLNLQEVTIGNIILKEVEILAQNALPHLKYLRSLRLPAHRLGEEGMKILCSALDRCTQLEELDLEAKREKYDGTPEIVSILPKLPALKKLKFLISKEGAVSLTTVLPVLSSLKSLSIRFPVSPENQTFFAALGSLRTLEDLEIFFLMSSARESPFPHIKKLTQLKSLVLNYSSFQDGTSDHLLGSMLLSLSKLERLEMNLSSRAQLNINTLAPCFSKLENLRILSLAGLSPLKENKAISLAKMLSHLSRLETLNMQESLSTTALKKIIPSLQLAPHLKEFHFSCGKDFQNLFLILTQLKTLEELHMFSYEQGDLGSLRGLKNSLTKSHHALQHSQLKEIYWGGYHLWDYKEETHVLKELSGIFKGLPALERVYFPKHALTPTGRHFLRTSAPSVRLCLYLGFWKGKNL